MRFIQYFIVCVCVCMFSTHSFAQIITVVPALPTDNDTVTVVYDATQGTAGLVGVSPVFAHTGVITDRSTSSSDWKYVVAQWGTPDSRVQLTPLGNNRHQLRFHVRSFYNVPTNESIRRLAFVFRNADGSREGKGIGGADIFYDIVSSNQLVARLSVSPQVLNRGEAAQFSVNVSSVASISLTVNNQLLISSNGTTLTGQFTPTQGGVFTFRLRATVGSVTLLDSASVLVRPVSPVSVLPAGVQDGINYQPDGSVILVLFAPFKQFIHVMSDLSNWQFDDRFLMNRTPDSTRYWIRLTNLTAQQKYRFQYVVDGTIRVGDPMASEAIYPGEGPSSINPTTTPYPNNLTTGVVTVFQTNAPQYRWRNNVAGRDWVRPAKERLMIYELLVRDFTDARPNIDRSYRSVIDSLDYLKRLGINALQLMPIMEFGGGSSWGYNPEYYFAAEKSYGPSDELKRLIDSAHSKGMVVILDMVLNQASGWNPYVLMWWDGTRPAANSPFFNQQATHPFSVFYDFNHESAATQAFVDRVNRYWLQEFKFDGYRFDLSKGFTQTNTGSDVGAWGRYDASRIRLLQRMADQIWRTDTSAYIILEHFAETREEVELGSYGRGMLLWSNMQPTYNEAILGYFPNGLNDQGFGNAYYKNRGAGAPHWVTYMESHDEERQMVKAFWYGNESNILHRVKDTNIALRRMATAAAFMFPIPGPKMIWQFGEFGYDVNLQGQNNDVGRLDMKPTRWNYLNNVVRRSLFDTHAALINLANAQPCFFDTTTQVVMRTERGNPLRFITLSHPTISATIVGNFDVVARNVPVQFAQARMWYDYFRRDSIAVTSTAQPFSIPLQPGEFRVLLSRQLPPPPGNVGIATSIRQPRIPLQELPSAMYPNPAEESVSFRVDDNARGIMHIRVVDALGKTIQQMERMKSSQVADEMISIENLPAGMYMVEISLADKRWMSKFVKH